MSGSDKGYLKGGHPPQHSKCPMSRPDIGHLDLPALLQKNLRYTAPPW